MMMSFGSSSGASSATVWSTTPAGTISHTARGAFICFTRSPSDDDPCAPSPASFCTVSALWSYTTHSCPPRINRRTMFAPIRPRPTIPSCIPPPRTSRLIQAHVSHPARLKFAINLTPTLAVRPRTTREARRTPILCPHFDEKTRVGPHLARARSPCPPLPARPGPKARSIPARGTAPGSAAAAEPTVEIEPVVRQEPIQPGMSWNTWVREADAFHLDFVLAAGCGAVSVVVAPRTPTLHHPLRVGPVALVKADLMHLRVQALRAPAGARRPLCPGRRGSLCQDREDRARGRLVLGGRTGSGNRVAQGACSLGPRVGRNGSSLWAVPFATHPGRRTPRSRRTVHRVSRWK